MKTTFELWLDSQQLPSLSRSLFREAISCYKSGAFRAAMIMSFLGLQNVIKDRILNSTKPTSFKASKWTMYLSQLRNDDKWDEATMNMIQARGDDNIIFNLSDDIRSQYMYWKYRRNDAAHTKNNEITQSHIEVFWSFIRSNLSKMVVIDSDQELINKIKDHFDINKTPVNKPYNHLIGEIPFAINTNEQPAFYENLDNVLLSSRHSREERPPFWNEVLNLREDLSTQAANLIKKHKDLIVKILKLDHSKVRYFQEPTYIRELWQQYIFSDLNINEFSLFITFINEIIPQEEAPEARGKFLYFLMRAYKNNPEITEDPIVALELTKNVYKSKIKQVLIEKMDFIEPDTKYNFWSNENSHITIFYLKIFGLDHDIALKIEQTFKKSKYPYSLYNSLYNLFKERPDLYEVLDNHLKESQLPNPITAPKTTPTSADSESPLPIPPNPPMNPSTK